MTLVAIALAFLTAGAAGSFLGAHLAARLTARPSSSTPDSAPTPPTEQPTPPPVPPAEHAELTYRVETVHPSWSPEQVAAEVAAILHLRQGWS